MGYLSRLNIVARAFAAILLSGFFLHGCANLPKIEILQSEYDRGQEEDYEIILPQEELPAYERLTYRVRWLGMTVGTFVTSIQGIRKYKDRDVYVLEAAMQSSGFLNNIYRIDDRFISYMDVEKKYSFYHEVHRSEGSYKKNEVTEFDQLNHKAHYKNLKDNSEKEFDIPEGVQDVVSAYYYFMLLPLDVGEKVQYHVCLNEKNYRFLGFVSSRALITLPDLGEDKIEAFRMQPDAKLNDKKIKTGSLDAYYSCDKRRLPLYVVVKGPIFTEITLTLIKVEKAEPPKGI